MSIQKPFVVKRQVAKQQWVRETRFGKWFLSTDIWVRYVLAEAIDNFNALLKERQPVAGRILDAGCGQGQAFRLLKQHYAPELIVGVDIDAELIDIAKTTAKQNHGSIHLAVESIHQLSYPDGYFNCIFCHQLLHHVSNQTAVLEEFYRVLSPTGLLLVSESCRSFIETFPVRLLFRHPMQVQKTAEEYIELVRSVGFILAEENIKKSTPWWSQLDFGLMQKWGLRKGVLAIPTEVFMVIKKC